MSVPLRWALGPVRTLRTSRGAWSQRRWDMDLPTESDMPPTLDAIDALAPAARARRAKGESDAEFARTRWETAFRSVRDSFTRPQLYDLAKEAQLRNIRSSLPKAELVRAFLEQRFSLKNPDVLGDASAFVPLELGDVFLLARNGRNLFEAARDADATVSIEKRDGQTGAAVRGTEQGIATLSDWLSSFCAHIHKASIEADAPLGLVHMIAERSGCYLEKEGKEIHMRFTDATAAHTAAVLLQQYNSRTSASHLACLGAPSEPLIPLPYAPGTLHSLADAYAMKSEHVRYTAPQHAAFATTGLSHVDLEGLREAAAPAPLPIELLGGEWKTHLRVAFGHAVWPATSQPTSLSDLAPSLFLPNTPPSCMRATELGPYTAGAEKEAEQVRLYYRATLDARPLDLVVTLHTTPERSIFQEAQWIVQGSTDILCPAASIDARISAQSTAPVHTRALRETALDTYLQSINAWGDVASPGVDALAPDAAPHHVPLAPRTLGMRLGDDFLHLSLYRTETVVQRTTPYKLQDEPEDEPILHLYKEATKMDAMQGFAIAATVRYPTYPDQLDTLALVRRTSRTALRAGPHAVPLARAAGFVDLHIRVASHDDARPLAEVARNLGALCPAGVCVHCRHRG